MSSECLNCGKRVSDQFARVFGDNDDNLHQCLECGKKNEADKSVRAK